ncbi:MAG: succinate-semialdehyde dehydrogenase, partial [Pseudomonadota bacterium]
MNDYPTIQLYIDGHWRAGAAARSLPVHNPATGTVMGQVACAETSDLEEVAAAAERGFAVWKRISAFERYKTMRKAAQLLRERVEHVARLMTLEQGKPLAEARMEILAGADTIDWFA